MNKEENKTMRAVKALVITWFVWSCLFIVSGIGNMIRFIFRETPSLFQQDFFTIFQIIICLFAFPFGGLEFSTLVWKQIKVDREEGLPAQEDSFWGKFKAHTSQPMFFLLFGLGFSAVGFVVGIFEICVMHGMEGVAWGIAGFYSLGTGLFTGISYFLIHRKETEEARKAARQRKEEELRRKEGEQKQKVCDSYLTTTGKRFFVKYYDYLHNWNESDIVDIIEEDYREQDKQKRIQAAKTIFKQDLQLAALEQIGNEESKIDEETRLSARKIIEREKAIVCAVPIQPEERSEDKRKIGPCDE